MPLANEGWLWSSWETFWGVTWTLCIFREFPDGKVGKEIPESWRLEFLEKFPANYFASSDAKDNTSGPLNRGGISDLLLLRTLLVICQKSREPSFWKVIDFFVIIIITKFGSFKNPFTSINILFKLTLDANYLFYWYKRKTWFLWVKATASATENHRGKWGLASDLQWGTYISVPTWNHSENSAVAACRSHKFKDILLWDNSQMNTKAIPMNTIIVISCTMKRGIRFLSLTESQWKLRQHYDQNFWKS